MKIVYVVGNFPTLSETFILSQITGLIDRGHEVEIVAYQNPGEKAIHEDVLKYGLLRKVHYLPYQGEGSLLSPLNVPTMLACQNADILHAHFAAEPADLALGVSRAIGIPFVITAHAYDIFIRPDFERLKYKFREAVKVLTVSEFNRRYLLKLLGEEFSEKIEVHYLGLDLNRFSRVERESKGDATILFVGRLVEKKGVLDAIRTAQHLVSRHPNVRLKIVGDGPQREDAFRMIQEFQLGANVSLMGGLTQEQVTQAMAEADIFFLPSVTAANGDREGLPVAIREAHAMGLPVVSTRHTGIPEAVVDGETGFLLGEHDTRGMARRISELLENPSLRLRMGRAGRALVESSHGKDQEIDRLEGVLRSVLASKKGVSLEKVTAGPDIGVPSVSIVIPTYNRSRYIAESIKSALAQDDSRLEVIVVDDGSTDETRAILSSMKDHRLRFVHKDHTGAPDTRNRGIEEAKGEYILWLDSDDVLMPGVVRDYLRLLSEFPEVDVVYGDLLVMDADGKVRQPLRHKDFYNAGGEIAPDLLFSNVIPNPGTLVRKSLYEKFGKYDRSFKRTHDYEFWGRIASRARFKHAGRAVCRWRWHDRNMSTGSVSTDTTYEARIVKMLLSRYSLRDLFPTLTWRHGKESLGIAYGILGEVFKKWNDYDCAAEYFEKSLSMKETALALQGLGEVNYRRKEFGRATALFERAVALDPALQASRSYLGKLLNMEKAKHELDYWKIRKESEGVLGNSHYEYFFTRHFGLDRSFFLGKKILDIGCGPRGSLEWAEGTALRVGLDPLAAAYREVGTGGHRMAYAASDSGAIPFPDGSFDVVSSFNSLDHVDNLDDTVAEIKRVLRPEGLFLLLTEVNHLPTPTEPLTFSWDVVNRFTDSLELVDIGHYEKGDEGLYRSIQTDTRYDHSNPMDRPGILSARFVKREGNQATLSRRATSKLERKINILFLSHSPDIGGAEICLLNLFKYLDRERFRPFAVFSRKGALKGIAESLNVKTFVSPIDWWIYPENLKGAPHWDRITSGFFPQVDALVRIIEEEGIDLVHTNTSVIWAGALAAKIAGVPHLWQIHEILDGHPSLKPYHDLSMVYSFMNSLSNRLVVVSKRIEEKLRPFIPAEKIEWIPNGIDLAQFRSQRNLVGKGIREELGLGKDDLLAGAAGNILREKGYDILIEAAGILRGRFDHLHFALAGAAGDPELAERLRGMAAERGLHGCFHFLGYRKDIPAILDEIDLYVNTSLTEASPLGIMEAMAAAKPVVAARCGGMEDVVAEGETGYLVEPGDPVRLAEAIERVLASRELRESLGSAGRDRARKYFDIRSQVSLLENQYLDLARDAEKSGPRTPDPVLRIFSDIFCSMERQWEQRFAIQQEQLQEQLSDLKNFVDGIRRTRVYRLYQRIRDFRRSLRGRDVK